MQTVAFDRTKYAEEFRNRHRVYETKQYKVFKKALDAQTQPVIDHLKVYGYITDNVIELLVRKTPMQSAYKECYITIGSFHAMWIMRKANQLGREQKGLLRFFSDKWKRLMEQFYISESSTRITEVTDTTRKQIKQVLADATDQRLTTSETATYMIDTLESKDFNRNRALMIARTESTTAANKGALLGGESADYEVGKIWIPIIDNRTRPAHAEQEGQPAIDVDDLFNVGGEYMNYPGDISATAENVVNCRCAVGIVPKIGINGLPILKKQPVVAA